MTEVVIAEDDGIGSMESNEEESVGHCGSFAIQSLYQDQRLSFLLRQH